MKSTKKIEKEEHKEDCKIINKINERINDLWQKSSNIK